MFETLITLTKSHAMLLKRKKCTHLDALTIIMLYDSFFF